MLKLLFFINRSFFIISYNTKNTINLVYLKIHYTVPYFIYNTNTLNIVSIHNYYHFITNVIIIFISIFDNIIILAIENIHILHHYNI